MGQTSSIMGHGSSTISAGGASSTTSTAASSQHQSIHHQGTSAQGHHYSSDASVKVASHKIGAYDGKRTNYQSPFGRMILADIVSPTEAARLLGELRTRRIIRAYRRAIVTSITASSSARTYPPRNYSNNNQIDDDEGYSSDEFDPDESEEEACDIDDVIELFFPPDVNESTTTLPIPPPPPPSFPRNINNNPQSNWFSSQYGIDKLAFPKLILPNHANPPLGVMDCIFTALTTSSNNYNNNSSPTSKIHLPDLIIFFAVFLCGSLELQAALAFRIYDSFQKQTTITRDILNRFIVAVYSNECAESALTKKLLDIMMDIDNKNFNPAKVDSTSKSSSIVSEQTKKSPQQQSQIQQPYKQLNELTRSQFVKGILLTFPRSPLTNDTEETSKAQKTLNINAASGYVTESSTFKEPAHLLIAWLQKLCQSMLPDASQIDAQLLISSYYSSTFRVTPSLSSKKTYAAVNAYLKYLYKQYKLTKMMQYECKRKFHSVCSIAVSVSSTNTSEPSSGDVPIQEEDSKSGTDISKAMSEELERQPLQPQKQHHHAINLQAFYRAVSDPNQDMGWGGYLPKSLARLVFSHGCRCHNNRHATNNIKTHRNFSQKYIKEEWTLSDAVSFACLSLREESDDELLKFCFDMFTFFNQDDGMHMSPSSYAFDHTTFKMGDEGKEAQKNLSKNALKKVLLCILDHASYRRQRDSTSAQRDNDIKEAKVRLWWYHVQDGVKNSGKDVEFENSNLILVDSSAATTLQLITKHCGIHEDAIFLDALVDYALEKAEEEHEMSLEGFKKWQKETNVLNSILMELKLIAGVVFGIRPSAPLKEFILVEEIKNRFKLRYPVTQTMRRGGDGTTWYILSTSWWKKWTEYSSPAMRQAHRNHSAQNLAQSGNGRSLPGRAVLSMPSSPGEINNNALLIPGSLALRRNITYKSDFELVPPLVWQALQAWHDGGPPIHRSVTFTNSAQNKGGIESAEIELYPFFLTIALADANTGQPRPFQQYVPVSKFQPLHILVDTLCKSLQYETEDMRESVRLWKMGNVEEGNDEIQLLDLDYSLRDQKISQVNVDGNIVMLILELRNDQGEWPRGNNHNDDIDGTATENMDTVEDLSTQVGDGIVGLYNMGNTCYLNSSIQCLSHTPLLRQYFTSKAYLKDINTTNIFGHQGRLAQVSAILINQLWKPGAQTKPRTLVSSYANSNMPLPCPSVTPKSFKEAIGKFNDHFAGNEQHDAQELLSYLLDGLSEDLNRIESKPYIEQPDSDGRPDKELADIWWRNHLLRELSIIVALFTGQYKSLLTCKVCHYESARFEPFMYLQLPLPEDNLMTVSVILFPLEDSTKVLRYSVRVREDGKVKDVLLELSRVIYHETVDKKVHNGEKEITIKKKDTCEPEGNVEDSGKDMSKSSFNDTEDDESDSKESEEDRIISIMADDMAVAEVRDCHVRSITPPTRILSDIQSRDTGEIPLLFVYELEPLQTEANVSLSFPRVQSDVASSDSDPEENSNENSSSNKQNEVKPSITSTDDLSDEFLTDESEQKSSTQNKVPTSPSFKSKKITEVKTDNQRVLSSHSKPSYIAIAQRKLEPLPHPFLHSFYLRTFDTPLLLRICELECYTGRDLYEMVAKRISRFTPGNSIETLLELASKDNDAEDVNCRNDKNDQGLNKSPNEDFSEAPSDEDLSQTTDVLPTRMIGDRRKQRQQTTIDMITVSAGPIPRFGFRLRITSRDCKRCSLCPWFECCIGCVIPDDDYPTIVKDGDSITLDWHMKVYNAFQKDQDEKEADTRKSSDYFKSQSQVLDSIERHKTCKDNNLGGGSITLEECLDAFAKEERIPEAFCSKCKDFRVSTKRMSLWRLPPVMIIHLKRFQFTQHMKRKLRNLVVFPTEGLDFSRIVASDNSNISGEKPQNTCCDSQYLHNENSNGEMSTTAKSEVDEPSTKTDQISSSFDGRSESLYDLYGVVHHQGALSTGHYVASLRSEIDGKWRLFNDAQVYELGSKEVVDATAYILFYVRRDVKSADLSDFWDTSSRDGEGLTEEQIDRLTKQRERCNIS